ncbi:MAG: hypothetical protein JW719_05230 [Pirellulales bacterium]|nr:hypothetical protein [Pirellulales bacterium]
MISDDSYFDDPDDALEDYEYPDAPDDEDDGTPTAPCPACGADVYEDADRCPVCGVYITPSGPGRLWAGRPLWWMVLGILGIVAVVVVLAVF